MNVNEIGNVGMTPYSFIIDLLDAKKVKQGKVYKVCNNTELVENDDNSVSVWLHKTEIIRARITGETIIRSGGYQTKTTKDRLNAFLPHSVYIGQKNWEWSVWGRTWVNLGEYGVKRCDHNRLGDFSDGMNIAFDSYGKVRYIGEYVPPISNGAAKRINAAAVAFTLDTDLEPTVVNLTVWNANYLSNGWPLSVDHHLHLCAERATQMVAAGMRKVAS